jgi:hypothetical protein
MFGQLRCLWHSALQPDLHFGKLGLPMQVKFPPSPFNQHCFFSGPISMDLICNQQPCTFPRLSCCGQMKVGANANRTAIICGHEEVSINML